MEELGRAGPQESDHVEQHDFEFTNPTLNVIRSASRQSSRSNLTAVQRGGEETPPPLPPRPNTLSLLDSRPSTSHASSPSRPQLVSKATTQLSYTDAQSFAIETVRNVSGASRGRAASDAESALSVRSSAPTTTTVGAGGDMEIGSMFGDGMVDHERSLLRSLGGRFSDSEAAGLFTTDPQFEEAFEHEFDDIGDVRADGSNEESVMLQWRAKLKHFLILSSAGKPIYSRHGSDQTVTNYIGIVQTLISFYQSDNQALRGFTAGDVRFVVMSKGPLNLVAITRLPESDSQLRAQLDALYMQILSTLTLPTVERMFAGRANYDLRRPLEGTDSLLSALADGFTRGSPSTLLSALECLKLRKSHRKAINSTFLKTRSENLLYGLIVASGKLVSVVRPKKHSLHPGDLHLIFNMLFEAGSVKTGGGENWIPLCLPGFNKTGYLYMYVSFLNLEHATEQVHDEAERPRTRDGDDAHEVAILLISANKESFYELRGMRDDLVHQMHSNGCIRSIRLAVAQGRPACTDIAPGTPLRHFLYKSRGNVQFVMPAWDPYFKSACERRNLMSLYARMQASLHPSNAPGGAPKIHHETGTTNIALAWSSPLFELYCVAPATTARNALALAAMGVVRWVRREEERVFVIGGAVF